MQVLRISEAQFPVMKNSDSKKINFRATKLKQKLPNVSMETKKYNKRLTKALFGSVCAALGITLSGFLSTSLASVLLLAALACVKPVIKWVNEGKFN